MSSVYEKVEQHKLGFYQLKEKPSEPELKAYYQNKYYQESKGTYTKTYTEKEHQFRINRLNRKLTLTEKFLVSENRKYLDIGCGEGWGLKFFNEAGWTVTGLDYSSDGIENFNPDLLDRFHQGDIYDNISRLPNGLYTNILLDNVLEHVLDPVYLISQLKSKCSEEGILKIEVPNDFSPLQLKLLELGELEEANWIVSPDHINYFSLDSLKNLMSSCGFQFLDAITDFPIDFFLANTNSNYYQKPELGKGAHQARLILENLMDELSVEKTLDFYRSMTSLGFGRNIIAFFRKP